VPDSETNIPGAEPKAPEGPTSITVRNAHGGGFSTRLKDKSGKFVRKPKQVPETREVTDMMRRLLNSAEADSNGKLIKGAKTRFRKMFDNMVDIATNRATIKEFDKEGNLESESADAKAMMAAVKAFEVLMARAYGKVAPGDEEMDALKTAGVKIVVIPPPDLMHPETVAEDHKSPTKPSFIDAEIIKQN
jgi:hypothetical protein